MKLLTRILAMLCAIVAQPFAVAASPEGLNNLDQALERLVTDQRENLGLVGLGVMIMSDGDVIASSVAGERKHRSGVPLTPQDKWHIGSITKSFTATLIARLVEQGTLSWDTKVGDVFVKSEGVNEAWNEVTVEQLLTHTSGAKSTFRPSLAMLFRKYEDTAERLVAREKLILEFMKSPLAAPPGSTFEYSNAGYVIAGVMAEKVTGLSWEDLIRQEVFKPLGIASGGFGAPKDHTAKLEQPRGHKSRLGVVVSTYSDPTLVIGPAGSIHMELGDLLVYANDHLQGNTGGGKLLEGPTYQKLHTPVLDNYAFGWATSPPTDWSNGVIIWHNGSNGAWDALLAIMPGSNTIIAVTSNDGRQIEANVTWSIFEKAAQLLR